MSWNLYLPLAGNSINLLLLFGLGGAVGFLSWVFGVGGGFLMTPLLIMVGIPSTVAAAADSNQIVAASTSASYAHYRLGNVDFKMGAFLIIGGLLGGTLGVQFIKLLRAMGNADFVIKITYVVMLGVIGFYMFAESLQSMRKKPVETPRVEAPVKVSLYNRMIQALPYQMKFEKSGVVLSPILPLVLGVFVGILAAIMGVGGGFIMVPVMVYMLRMPMHVVVGTSLFQILFTCINVTFMQSLTNHNVDLVLAIILLVGSTLGAQIGAKLSRKLKADQLKILLASIVIVVMVQILVGLILTPHLLLGYKAGH